ncbi:substrate-binding domain-containing protein [uncultured Slackia sp.]|uniref:substrate-binding domain-containing protein n=1 Tax=uncultured Slackia sp. TaxID=665903 RepID=UPI0026DEFEAC|nr:substrate-binding domain-containing protein [uncultured Slackia sp.]
MKSKKLLALALSCVCAIGAFALVGCSSGGGESSDGSAPAETAGAISVISREDGSGTRGAFTELFGVLDDNKKDATTSSAVVTNSTSVMMTTVAGDPASIGYISLGSLNDTVKAVKIDGVAPSAEGVKDGSYKVARPFNVVTNDNISEVAQDFLNFIMSAEGQEVVDADYVSVADNAESYTASGKSGKVVVAGSSSVTPIMEKLAEAYEALNPDVKVEVQQSDSSTGVQSTIDGTCDLGMASRELKDSELSQGVKPVVIAMDGIAVIVNTGSSIDDLTTDQVKGIFTGDITDWSEIA